MLFYPSSIYCTTGILVVRSLSALLLLLLQLHTHTLSLIAFKVLQHKQAKLTDKTRQTKQDRQERQTGQASRQLCLGTSSSC